MNYKALLKLNPAEGQTVETVLADVQSRVVGAGGSVSEILASSDGVKTNRIMVVSGDWSLISAAFSSATNFSTPCVVEID